MAHSLSLAFTPTAIIGVDKELRMPKFEFLSNTRPSLFAYQPATTPPTTEKVEKVATAVLSTTAKVKAREKTKKDKLNADEMEMTLAPESPMAVQDPMKIDEESSTNKKKLRRKEEGLVGSSTDKLSNLSRVTPTQLAYISFPDQSRYLPVRPLLGGSSSSVSIARSKGLTAQMVLHSAAFAAAGAGILVVRDQKPELPGEFLELTSVKELVTTAQGSSDVINNDNTGDTDAGLLEGPIADLPPAFEYDFNDD